MPEQRYRARDKTVKKMSRDGLAEENLSSRETVRVSRRETDSLSLPGQAEDSFELGETRRRPVEGGKEPGQSRRRYSSDFEKPGTIRGKPKEGEPAEIMPIEDAGRKTKTAIRRYQTAQTEELEEREEAPGETAEDVRHGISEQSARMGSIRGHPASAAEFAEAAVETRHSRKKKMVQDYARKERAAAKTAKAREGRLQTEDARYRRAKEPEGESLEKFRDEIKDKAKKERLNREQRKKAVRLFFGDEENGMVRGAGTGIVKKTVSAAYGAAAVYLHGKGHEAEGDNAAVEGSHRAELMAESALRRALHRTNRGLQGRNMRLREAGGADLEGGRLHFGAVQEAEKAAGRKAAQEKAKSNAVKKFWQKQRYKKAYLAARQGRKETAETVRITQNLFTKVKRAVAAIAWRNKGIFGAVAVIVLLFALMAMSLTSCSAVLQGATASIAGTTYPSTDEDIYAVENAYVALENALNEQINRMESAHPGYDEYRYQVDEIFHNPYHLISYFTAKYGEFTYEQVKDEVEEIFREQYRLSTQETTGTVTETRTVRVGESLGQVVTSGYCNCPICCGVWSGGPTASGAYPTANHTLAVDASNPFVPMGTRVVMNGVEYVVEDTGAFDQYGVQFDVYYDSHAAASAHGHQTWEAYIADDNGQQEVEVTSTRQVNRLDVTLTNRGLDAVLRSRMDENEEKRYDLYNTTLGHRDYLFDVNTIPGGGAGGFGYEIPAEALSDVKFANMIREAEKYLGYPYVWGGSSPSTSFDCSGFVSWVINNCGNGWNIGRCTADGLRSHCAYVSPSQAKPGDLIFFQGTYNTSGASHVGIYVGNNMMIHCGNPIQYTSIATSYWQQHFMAFGRIQ